MKHEKSLRYETNQDVVKKTTARRFAKKKFEVSLIHLVSIHTIILHQLAKIFCIYPAEIRLFKVKNKNTRTSCETCSKVNNKDTKMTQMASF